MFSKTRNDKHTASNNIVYISVQIIYAVDEVKMKINYRISRWNMEYGMLNMERYAQRITMVAFLPHSIFRIQNSVFVSLL
jgi:hypothetical protein